MSFPLKTYQLCLVLALFSLVGIGNSVSTPVDPPDHESEDWDYPSSSVTTFIINGSFAEAGEFPHHVALYNTTRDEYIHCGGSILTPRLILTAAHCFEHTPPRDLQVIAGLTNLNFNGKATEQTKHASYVYFHEDYDAKTQVNDLAMIELDSPLEYNDHVWNIKLANENETFETNVTVIGWGSTELDFYSAKLRKDNVRIVRQEKCEKLYRNSSFPVTENHLCAGKVGGGVCKGDSGGPAICNTDTAPVLCGVVSFGGNCSRTPGVFTRVTSFLDWIRQAEHSIQAQKAAEKLIENGVNAVNNNTESPLHQAAGFRDKATALKIIKRLIKVGTVVSMEDSEGFTFLHRLLHNTNNKMSPKHFRDLVEYLVSENLFNLFNIQEPTQGRTPLMLAAANLDLDLDTLSLLRSNGVDFTLVDKTGKSGLFYSLEGSNNQKLLGDILDLSTIKLDGAIMRKDEILVMLLVQLGADVNARNINLETPLHHAAAIKDKTFAYKIIKILIDSGADATVTDAAGQTFLHELLSDGTTLTSSDLLDMAQYLFSRRLSSLFNIKDGKRGSTPLMLAAKNVELDRATLVFLQRTGVNFRMVDNNNMSHLFYGAEGNKNRKLLSEEIKSSIKDLKLAEAIKATDEHSVKVLVWLGADLNGTNDEWGTYLHLAATSNNKTFAVNIIKFLIDSGANAYALDRIEFTFLHSFAQQSGIKPTQFHDMAAFLVSKNLTKLFNTVSRLSKNNPFLFAVQTVEIERATLTLLKNNGVDFNAGNYRRWSVLYCATRGNRTLRLISDLVELGAKVEHLTKYKESMLHAAASRVNVELLKFFLDIGLDVNAQNTNGDTPLHYVFTSYFEANAFKPAQLLLRNGAKADMVNDEGKTPLDIFNSKRDRYHEADKITTCLTSGSSC